MDTPTRVRASQLFGALSHPTRLRIVERLIEGERTVNDLASELEIGQSGASQHLAILTRAGICRAEARGASRVYRVRGPRIAAILELIEAFCEIHGLYGEAADDEHDPLAARMDK